jgi:phosphoglycerol transferase MdoB-like AlkP superfamily enzyme
VLMLSSTVYVAFYTQLFDPAMLAVAGQLTTVTDAIGQLIKPAYILFLIDIPLLVAWVITLGRRAREQRARMEHVVSEGESVRVPRGQVRPTRRSLGVAAVTVLAVMVFGGQLAFASRLPSWIDGVAIARSRGLIVAQVAALLPQSPSDGSNDTAAATETDAPTSTVPVVSRATTVPTTPEGKTEARIERIRGSLNGSRIATFSPGAFLGKNVILIQVEALNTMVMQKSIGGHEITPALNKLIQQSWYFPNTYSETGIGNTADAEFVVNSSLYTPRGQAAPVVYADRTIPALPRLVRKIGYDAFTMHQNQVAYWNRKELYAALGFARYYDSPFFHWEDMMGPMGSSDEVLFRKGITVLQQEDASRTPSYSMFITLSAHTPFEFIPNSRRPLKTPTELQGSLLGNYISAESYSDLAIGKFIADLKASKIWDKSVVIIYGDHTAMIENELSGKDAKAAQELLGRDYGPADRQRIPLIIHLPLQTTSRVVTQTVGQVDIMPTVADLLGIDLTSVPHMGRSVFVDSNPLVPLRSYLPGGTFVNDRVVFMPGMGFDDGTSVKIADGSQAKATDEEKTDFQRVLELTKISDTWVRSLKKRKDAGKLQDAWIPDAAARGAAAQFGALQEGTGNGK